MNGKRFRNFSITAVTAVLQGLSGLKLPRWWHDEVTRAFKLGGLDVHSCAQHVE